MPCDGDPEFWRPIDSDDPSSGYRRDSWPE